MTPAELKTLREACGLSLPNLATISGVQERTARYWETGHTNVPTDVADMINKLDVQISIAANEAVNTIANHARQHPDQPLADIVLLRYRTDSDLHHFRPDMRGLPTTTHAAIIYRTRTALFEAGIPVRIVYMRPEDYAQWLCKRKDTEATRAEWAGLQIPESHL